MKVLGWSVVAWAVLSYLIGAFIAWDAWPTEVFSQWSYQDRLGFVLIETAFLSAVFCVGNIIRLVVLFQRTSWAKINKK